VSTSSTISLTTTLAPAVYTTSSITASSTSLRPVERVSTTTAKSPVIPEVVESIKEEPKLAAGIAVSLMLGILLLLIAALIIFLLAKKGKKGEEKTRLESAKTHKK
jgi:uncharacterized membrane protein